jgi:cysteine synthase A
MIKAQEVFMSKIYTSSIQLIGNTPLLELTHIEQAYDLSAKIIAKLEYFNVTGSVKDRIARAMIEDAEQRGILKEGSVIIEPTSGNTGIGLASVGTSKGYRVIIVMPDSFSIERRKLIQAYGAEIVLSEGAKGMKGAIAKANELAAEIPNAFIPGQFDNLANRYAHYTTTGPEIWKDTDGQVDIFVAGVGTGGTVSGAGKYLKEQDPSIEVVAVEPDASPVLSGGTPGPHKIQGIGPGFIAPVTDPAVIDRIIRITNEDALRTGREIGQKEGILVGISAGAALAAAIQLAKEERNAGKNIIVILPDSGDRYLSTALFE